MPSSQAPPPVSYTHLDVYKRQVLAFETTGHTKCSLSYIVDGELMLCSESVGVMGPYGGYMPAFLVDYIGARESILKSAKYHVKEIILNHYGPVSEADKPRIWDILLEKLEGSKKQMTDVMKRCTSDEEALKELERVFHGNVDKKEQPDEAFNICLLYTSGMDWERNYRDEDLRVDVVLEDGETVKIGNHSVLAFETCLLYTSITNWRNCFMKI